MDDRTCSLEYEHYDESRGGCPGTSQRFLKLIDLNGDGLLDRMATPGAGLDPAVPLYVKLFDGRRWRDVDWPVPANFPDVLERSGSHTGTAETTITLMDFNGDGLVDLVQSTESATRWLVFFNTGHSFQSSVDIAVPFDQNPLLFSNYDCINGDECWYRLEQTRLLDMNGDRAPDKIALSFVGDPRFTIQINHMADYGLLKYVRNVITKSNLRLWHGWQSLDSTELGRKNYRRARVLQKFQTSNPTVAPPMVQETNFSYHNGLYDHRKHEFRGFKSIKRERTVDNLKYVDYYEFAVGEISLNPPRDSLGTELVFPHYSEYIRGQLVHEHTEILQQEALGEAWKPIKLTNWVSYQYDEVPVLDRFPEIRYVYQSARRHRLVPEVDPRDQRDDPETSVFVYHEMDTTNGIITASYKYNDADPYQNGDDELTHTKFFNVTTKTEWFSGLTDELVTTGGYMQKHTGYAYMPIQSTGAYAVKERTDWIDDYSAAGPTPYVSSLEYDEFGGYAVVNSTDGLSTRFTVQFSADNTNFRRVTTMRPNGLETERVFDVWGHQVLEVSHTGENVQSEYDDAGRLVRLVETRNGTAHETLRLAYHDTTCGTGASSCRQVVGVKVFDVDSARGDVSFEQYFDVLGRLIQSKRNAVVDGTPAWIVSGRVEFNQQGNIVRNGQNTVAPLEHSGWVESPFVNPTQFAYDAEGNAHQTTLPSGYQVTRFTSLSARARINDKPRVVAYTVLKDSEGRSSTTIRDLAERTLEVRLSTSSDEVVTTYEYSPNGYSMELGPLGLSSEKQLDSSGRLLWLRTPDAGRTEYRYGPRGQVSSMIQQGKNENDATRIQSDFYYDALNRLVFVNEPGTRLDTYYRYYDASSSTGAFNRGELQEVRIGGNGVTGSELVVSYQYGRDFVIETRTNQTLDKDTATYATAYSFDLAGRTTRVVYPDGEVVGYSYDVGGNLESIAGESTYIAKILYNENLKRTHVTYGNGVTTGYTYDPVHQTLKTMHVRDSDSTLALALRYEFDNTGNVQSITDEVPAGNGLPRSIQAYRYDQIGRLARATGASGGDGASYDRSYRFDKGNRLLEKHAKTEATHTYSYHSDTHALQSVHVSPAVGSSVAAMDVELDYDDFGNLHEQRVRGEGPRHDRLYEFDARNRLTSLKEDSLLVAYSYDHRGLRSRKIVYDLVDGIRTFRRESTYIGGLFARVNDRTGVWFEKSVSDGNTIFASVPRNNPTSVIYFTANNIGSTVLVTDAFGQSLSRHLYYPFGELWDFEPDTTSEALPERLFTNQIYDKETGLYYYEQRYYDPFTAHFLRPDPAFDGFNHYGYAHANPIIFVDPTGEISELTKLGEVGEQALDAELERAGWTLFIVNKHPNATGPDQVAFAYKEGFIAIIDNKESKQLGKQIYTLRGFTSAEAFSKWLVLAKKAVKSAPHVPDPVREAAMKALENNSTVRLLVTTAGDAISGIGKKLASGVQSKELGHLKVQFSKVGDVAKTSSRAVGMVGQVTEYASYFKIMFDYSSTIKGQRGSDEMQRKARAIHSEGSDCVSLSVLFAPFVFSSVESADDAIEGCYDAMFENGQSGSYPYEMQVR